MENENITTKKTGATLNRGNSKQDYETPQDFMEAVYLKFGKPVFDLAASPHNKKCDNYFSITDNSLIQNWHKINGLLWLNPEYDNIKAWAKKCHEESLLGAEILFLVPSSVGSNWYADYVFEKSMTYFLRPRLVFVGHDDPYPRDLMLCHYGMDSTQSMRNGIKTWQWMESKRKKK